MAPFFHVRNPPINKLPASVDELIDELDRLVPERLAQPGDTMDTVQRHAGKRELVLWLKTMRSRGAKEEPRIRERKR